MIERERAAIEAARRLLAAVDAMFVPSGVWDRPFFADVNCFMNEPESPRTLEESAAFFEAVETARDELRAALDAQDIARGAMLWAQGNAINDPKIREAAARELARLMGEDA